MQPENKTSDELIDRYEKSFGAAGRRRSLIIIGLAGLLFVVVIGAFAGSMSYIGKLNAHVYNVFDAPDSSKDKAKPEGP